jgi:hypothetical protein
MVPMPLTLVPVYSLSVGLLQVTHPVSTLLICGVSLPGGILGPELVKGAVRFGSVGRLDRAVLFRALNLGASFFHSASRSRHSRANRSACALASELAHFFGPFFLPVVLNIGGNKCIVIRKLLFHYTNIITK